MVFGISWDHWLVELIIAAIEFNVQKFVNDVADSLPVAAYEVLWLQVLGALGSELLDISDQFGQRICKVAFEVAEWDEHTKFLRLNANKK